MTTAKVIIENAGDDFYRGKPVKLKVRLEAEVTTSRMIVISSDAFSPKDKTINLKPLTDSSDATLVEFNPWQNAKVNHAYVITASGGDSSVTAKTDQAYQITYKYPTVTFDGLSEKKDSRVSIRLVLNKPLAAWKKAEAVVSGDCLEPGKTGWSQEDNGYLFKFYDGTRWKTLYLHVKETGFADSTLTLKAKLRCVTASSGTTHDLQLTPKKLPKLQFGEPSLKAEKIPGTDKYQIGTGELVCRLDAEALSKGATAEIIGDYLEHPIALTFKAGKKQTAPVSINLKSTGGQTKKLTLKAVDGCELDDAAEKTKIELQVEEPKLDFEDSTPLEADTVPNKSETFRVGKAAFRCKVSYWLAKDESPGRLVGDCLETPVDLEFESDSVATGSAGLKDTGGKAATVTLQLADGYGLNAEGTTSLDVTVESPTVKFTENPTDAKKHPHKSDVYQIGQAGFTCESTYQLPDSQAPATLTGDAIEGDVTLFFPDEHSTIAKEKAVLKDTDGQSVKLALIPEEGYTADQAGSNEIEMTVESPGVSFSQDTPDGEKVPDNNQAFREGAVTFPCQLSYALPEGARAQIKSEHLKRSVSVVFESEIETVDAKGILKDSDGKTAKFTLVAQRNCCLDTEKTTELDVIVEAPKIRFDQNVPEQPEGTYPGEAAEFGAKPSVFRCKLNYAAPETATGVIESEFLTGRKTTVRIPKGEEASASVKTALKDTQGKKEPFTLKAAKNCRLADSDTVINLKVKDSFSGSKGGGEVQECQNNRPIDVTVIVRVRHGEEMGAAVDDILVQLKGGQTYEKTSENGGKAIFKDVQKGAYTISAKLDERQQNKYRAAEPVKITVASEPDPVELELEEIQFIKIKLVEHFGQPVADEPYVIESADGEEIASGNLDENGEKTIEVAVSGDCIVKFPNWYVDDFVPEDQMGTFIHLDMRGYAGVAIPGEKYRLKNNNDETLHEGRLDSSGQIEHQCPPGEYTVEFPEWYAHDFTLFSKIGTGG